MKDKRLKQKIEQLQGGFGSWYAKYRAKNPGPSPEIAGFNMPYSTIDTWNSENDVLILTTNPRAQPSETKDGKENRPTIYTSHSPWPQNNEMYAVKFNNQAKFLKAFEQVAHGLGDSPEKAENRYAMWSVVPYRTYNAGLISAELWDMVLYKVWGPIFGIWLPANVVVFGSDAYDVIKSAISMHAFFVDERKEQPVPKKPYLKCTRFISPERKRINLFDLPHPSRNIGYYTGEKSRAFEFITKMRNASDKEESFQ